MDLEKEKERETILKFLACPWDILTSTQVFRNANALG